MIGLQDKDRLGEAGLPQTDMTAMRGFWDPMGG